MDTFDALNLPFPLFKAPVTHASIDDAGPCAHCGLQTHIRFFDACYDCLRAGKADSGMDTELGMILREDANLGRTHGLPLRDPSKLPGYELTAHPVDPNFPDQTWYYVHVERDGLLELLRTPKYHTWQGEQWLFCCNRPMVFRGSLPVGLFGDDVTKHPFQIVEFLKAPDWRKTVEDGHGSHTYYAFHCADCGRLRFHDDCD